ncbi:hypothetical protein HC766_02295 [Candidatus Gracilibacteria bacterium]|nr:hypothetical protein [Candidatus Gracilibacteria bacterium]
MQLKKKALGLQTEIDREILQAKMESGASLSSDNMRQILKDKGLRNIAYNNESVLNKIRGNVNQLNDPEIDNMVRTKAPAFLRTANEREAAIMSMSIDELKEMDPGNFNDAALALGGVRRIEQSPEAAKIINSNGGLNNVSLIEWNKYKENNTTPINQNQSRLADSFMSSMSSNQNPFESDLVSKLAQDANDFEKQYKLNPSQFQNPNDPKSYDQLLSEHLNTNMQGYQNTYFGTGGGVEKVIKEAGIEDPSTLAYVRDGLQQSTNNKELKEVFQRKIINTVKKVQKTAQNYGAGTSTKNLAIATLNAVIGDAQVRNRLQDPASVDVINQNIGLEKTIANIQKDILQGGAGSNNFNSEKEIEKAFNKYRKYLSAVAAGSTVDADAIKNELANDQYFLSNIEGNQNTGQIFQEAKTIGKKELQQIVDKFSTK